MEKKWIYVNYLQGNWHSYVVFMTEEEIVDTRLAHTVHRGKSEDYTFVYELSPEGEEKERKDLIEAGFKTTTA